MASSPSTVAANHSSPSNTASTKQELFVCLSVAIYCATWLPLCISKYPDDHVDLGLTLLLFSFLCTSAGCLLYFVSAGCAYDGYQRAGPLCLVIALIIGFGVQFVFDHEYCHAFYATNYDICYFAEFLSFMIYLATIYYLICVIVFHTNFKVSSILLRDIRSCFGPRIRMKILLAVNIAMLIVIFCHIHIYSYAAHETDDIANALDVIWVALATILTLVSIMIRFRRCMRIVAQRCILLVMSVLAMIAFVMGALVAWQHRISNLDGVARIGNVFIWCVINQWVLLEFMTTDIDKMMYRILNQSMQSSAKLADTESLDAQQVQV